MRLQLMLGVTLLVPASAPVVVAQIPPGSEFQVNTFTDSNQRYASVAADPSGAFVVAWVSWGQDGEADGVFAQRFDEGGSPLGAEFRVNVETVGTQTDPSVAWTGASGFVVVWASRPEDYGMEYVRGRRYDAAGTPLGAEFQVSTSTTKESYHPAVASDAAGNFVVAWEGYYGDGSRNSILARRYDASGVALGAELLVNTYSTGHQRDPAVAVDGAGAFVVAWESDLQDGSGWGVFAQRFDAGGVPQGSESQVNSSTAFDQVNPSVTADAAGNYVVAWEGLLSDGFTRAVLAQRVGLDGLPRGAEFQVSALDSWWAVNPSVAASPSGPFVVAWEAATPSEPDSGVDIYARAYDATGATLGSEFRVNQFTEAGLAQTTPAVASDSAGDLVFIWTSDRQDGSYEGVFGRQLDDVLPPPFSADVRVTKTDGVDVVDPSLPVTYTIEVTNAGPDPVSNARVIDVFAGAFQNVSWSCAASAGASCPTPPFGLGDIDALVELPVGESVTFAATAFLGFGAFGTVSNTTSVVLGDLYGDPDPSNNSATDIDTIQPPGIVINDISVVEGDSGTTLATFTAILSRPIDGVVSVQYATTDGTAAAPGDYHVSTGTLTFDPLQVIAQASVEIVGDEVDEGDEDFHLILSDATNAVIDDGDGLGTIQDDENALLMPEAIALSPLGQGVWGPGTTVSVQPAWRNVGDGSTPSVTGQADVASGGSIDDGAANYGVFASGEARNCAQVGDCYAVTATGPRPATHWDVVLTETLSLGASHGWRLHVGDSFSDVPRGSASFRFVETLLHHGVTGGCGVDAYCPQNAVSREQVAVFTLVGKEGAGYQPPACGTTPLFGDVPPSSPFCRWIEELARRGVVGGCGGGNYCPANPVTREQMPVFVLLTLDPTIDPPACGTTPVFADVPAGSPFCRWIEELARRGVVSGCGGGNYCPSDPVTREQMAVFVGVTFGLALYGP